MRFVQKRDVDHLIIDGVPLLKPRGTHYYIDGRAVDKDTFFDKMEEAVGENKTVSGKWW